MSTSESRELVPGQPALLEDEITSILKRKNPVLDVLVVGMNPSLSQRTYKQLYDRLKKRGEQVGLLEVLNELRFDGGNDFVKCLANEFHWNQWVEATFSYSNASGKEEALSKLQYYFVEGRNKPLKDEITWPVVGLGGNLSKCKTINYFDTIRRTLAAGLTAMESKSQKRELTWYQIDLFHERETVQASFLSSLIEGKEWNSRARDAVATFWERVEVLNPKVLLVANSNVTDLIFTNYDQVLQKTFNFEVVLVDKALGKPCYGITSLLHFKSNRMVPNECPRWFSLGNCQGERAIPCCTTWRKK